MRKVELPWSSAQVEGEKKQKVENEKALAQKERRKRQQNLANLPFKKENTTW